MLKTKVLQWLWLCYLSASFWNSYHACHKFCGSTSLWTAFLPNFSFSNFLWIFMQFVLKIENKNYHQILWLSLVLIVVSCISSLSINEISRHDIYAESLLFTRDMAFVWPAVAGLYAYLDWKCCPDPDFFHISKLKLIWVFNSYVCFSRFCWNKHIFDHNWTISRQVWCYDKSAKY